MNLLNALRMYVYCSVVQGRRDAAQQAIRTCRVAPILWLVRTDVPLARRAGTGREKGRERLIGWLPGCSGEAALSTLVTEFFLSSGFDRTPVRAPQIAGWHDLARDRVGPID